MDIILEDHLNSTYFGTLDENFLGKKQFYVRLISKTPENNISVEGYKNYDFQSKKKDEKSAESLKSFVSTQSFKFDKIEYTNTFKPHEEDFISNSLSYDTGKYGQFTLTQKSTKTKPFSSLLLRHSFVFKGFDSKIDLGYSTRESLIFSSFTNYKSRTNIFTSYFPDGFEHNFGSLLKASILDAKIRNFSFFFYLKYTKYRLTLAQYMPNLCLTNSSSDQPTLDNFFDQFIVGFEKASEENSSILMKLKHDYRNKESQIDLLKETKINNKASITNKITSNYNIGTSLTYKFNNNIKISHCSEIDLKKFFKEEENYKYGVKIDITL